MQDTEQNLVWLAVVKCLVPQKVKEKFMLLTPNKQILTRSWNQTCTSRMQTLKKALKENIIKRKLFYFYCGILSVVYCDKLLQLLSVQLTVILPASMKAAPITGFMQFCTGREFNSTRSQRCFFFFFFPWNSFFFLIIIGSGLLRKVVCISNALELFSVPPNLHVFPL